MSLIRRLLRSALHRLGPDPAVAATAPLPKPSDATGPFEFEARRGHIDTIDGAPLPLLRVHGWFADARALPLALTTLAGRRLEPIVYSRTQRPDVLAQGLSSDDFCGFRADFLLEAGERPHELELGGKALGAISGAGHYAQLEPHYGNFFTHAKVMGRNSIYGSGPPVDGPEEYKAFALAAHGDVLDFGCGNGDVVTFLRAHGREAVGLELDEPRIRNALKPDAAAHATLYAGDVPLPFADARFDWVVSIEVIEHVSDIATYVPELARVLRPGGRLLVTTPDITSIPSSFPAGCVPWHLLEATHINFFTPRSVVALFAPAFDLEATYCLGSSRINGLFVPGSIGAIFRRR